MTVAPSHDRTARPQRRRTPPRRHDISWLGAPSRELELARRIRAGDSSARREMVEANLGLVHAIGAPYRSYGVPLADLIQEGTVGLIQAVERFDPDRGLKFSTYAAWWIRRAVIEAIGAARPIRVPAQARRQLAAVWRAEHELERCGTRHVSSEAIAARTGLGSSSVTALRTAGRVTASLEQPVGDDATQLGELLSDPESKDPAELACENEAVRELQTFLRLLPERHRQILIRRYGLGGGQGQSHRQVGSWLGVKQERSRQLEREALHRLRELASSSARATSPRLEREQRGPRSRGTST
jgi:RNA polymerase primary sigma factor